MRMVMDKMERFTTKNFLICDELVADHADPLDHGMLPIPFFAFLFSPNKLPGQTE